MAKYVFVAWGSPGAPQITIDLDEHLRTQDDAVFWAQIYSKMIANNYYYRFNVIEIGGAGGMDLVVAAWTLRLEAMIEHK